MLRSVCQAKVVFAQIYMLPINKLAGAAGHVILDTELEVPGCIFWLREVQDHH